MKYYLLDYENVNASGLDGIGELTSDCRIVLFYTKNSSKIDLGVFNMLRSMKAEMSIIEVHHGKQALDIQLASYLGYLIGTEPADTEYYIISKDKGYRNVQSFWPDRRIVLCRNLSPDSEIVDEPAPEKKTSSRSGSRGGRKSSAAKASTAAEEPKEKPKASRSSGRTKAQSKPAEDVKVEEAKVEDVKKKPPKKDAPKAEPAVSEEPKPNAFAEAAAIAKAVVEAKKARNEAAQKKAEKAEKAEDAPAEKPAEKEEKPAKKTKKTASKKKAAETKQKADEAKPKADSKQKDAEAKQKAAEAKHKASDARNEVNNEIQKRLSRENIDGDIINSTASFVSKNIGKDGYKQIIYRGIIKEHGQKQGLAIYRLIKDIL